MVKHGHRATGDSMQKIVPCLWFDDQVEDAARKVERVTHAFMAMKKLDLDALQAVYAGQGS
jgi:predicted 3-demethylubiquinone-9 3-methyltransferase (glyoxalase superfamily)